MAGEGDKPGGSVGAREDFWSSIPLAAKIAGVFIVVVGTFFATRYSLEREISEIKRGLPIHQYTQRALLYEQVTNLRLIEIELKRIYDHVMAFRKPEFVFATPQSPEATRMFGPPPPWWSTEEIVIGMKGQASFPEQLPIEAFTMVALTPAMRSLPPPDNLLVGDLYAVHLAIANYNQIILRADSDPHSANPAYRARVGMRLTKPDALRLADESLREMEIIKTRVPSLIPRVVEARERLDKFIDSQK